MQMCTQLWLLVPVLSQEVNDVEGVPVPHPDGQVERRLSGLLSAKGSRNSLSRPGTAHIGLSCHHGNYRKQLRTREGIFKPALTAADRFRPDPPGGQRPQDLLYMCDGEKPESGLIWDC